MVNPTKIVSMARKSQEMRRLEAKEIELAADIARLQVALSNALEMQRDIQTTKRVLEELSGISPAPPEPDDPDPGDDHELDEQTEAGKTIGQMAMTLLRNDPSSMTSNDILDEIRRLWLPDLMRTSLSPPLSRLKKKGAIYLDGDLWKVTPQIEADPWTGKPQ